MMDVVGCWRMMSSRTLDDSLDKMTRPERRRQGLDPDLVVVGRNSSCSVQADGLRVFVREAQKSLLTHKSSCVLLSAGSLRLAADPRQRTGWKMTTHNCLTSSHHRH